jgi:hypothetical protein
MDSGRDEAIAALKESVKLENPSDWQLLIELTSGRPGAAVNATLLLAGAQSIGGEDVSAEAAAIAADMVAIAPVDSDHIEPNVQSHAIDTNMQEPE